MDTYIKDEAAHLDSPAGSVRTRRYIAMPEFRNTAAAMRRFSERDSGAHDRAGGLIRGSSCPYIVGAFVGAVVALLV